MLNFGLLGQGLRATGFITKFLCCIVCCCSCGGPIMLLAGIILVSTTNNNSERVSSFNAAAAAFGDGSHVMRPLLPSTGSYDSSVSGSYGGNFSLKLNYAAPLPPMKNDDGVTSDAFSRSVYYSIPFPRPSGELSPPTISSDLDLRLYVNRVSSLNSGGSSTPNTTTYISDTVASLDTSSVTMYCTFRKSGCSASSMRSKCESDYGSRATYEGSGCSSDGACGRCTFSAYLKRYCVVIDTEGLAVGKSGVDGSGGLDVNTYDVHQSMKGCTYPFARPVEYSSTYPNVVEISLMASTDPSIVLQRLTEGSMDFGTSAAQQRANGLQLISIGVICLFICAILSFVIYRVIVNNRNQNPHAYGLTSGMYSLPGGSAMEMGAMGQPNVYMPHQNAYNGFVSDQNPAYPYPGGGAPFQGQPLAYAGPGAAGGGYSPYQPDGGQPHLNPYALPPPPSQQYPPQNHAAVGGGEAYIPPPPQSVGGAYGVPRGGSEYDNAQKNL